MAPKTTWILVGDASRAYVFEERPSGRSSLVASFEHPDSRAHVVDLVSDAQGRMPVGGRRGSGVRGHAGSFEGRPGAEPDTDPKEVEAQRFAHELAEMLQKRLDDHAYEALVLAAPPHFLGLLREAVGAQVDKRIEATLDKDLAGLPPREIEERLREARAA
jgi:protein required for attachment to host cells